MAAPAARDTTARVSHSLPHPFPLTPVAVPTCSRIKQLNEQLTEQLRMEKGDEAVRSIQA